MRFIGFGSHESKIMLLQLRKVRKLFISVLNGDLLQKGSTGSKENAELLKKQIRSSMNKTNWEFVPRAKLAANIHFHANYANIPTIPRLVKYLLDILCEVICSDDRQIEYLSAYCYRPSNSGSESLQDKDSIFIEVERLTDFKQKFKLFHNLINNDDFRNYAEKHHYLGAFLNDDDTDIERQWPDEETASALNLSQVTVEAWHRMIRTQNQQKMLSLNKINVYDWPDGLKEPFYQMLEEMWDLNPFIFKMEGLPTSGGKGKYKKRLSNKLKELNERLISFGKIIAPLELDVQVRLNNMKLKKDLDNIMLDLSNIFTEEVIEEGSYLRGYRIYVTKVQNGSSTRSSLRFKLLPLYGIQDFNCVMEDTLKLGVEWLEDRI